MILQDFARPLPVASMHVQTAPRGVPQRLPFGTGHLEVLRIERLRKSLHQPKPDETDGPFVRALMVVEGIPGSTRSTARHARFAFVEPGVEPPLSRADHTRGLLHVYYPLSDFDRIAALLRTGKQRICYCWHSADSTRSVVMLMAMG
jgi:hypothetical protein